MKKEIPSIPHSKRPVASSKPLSKQRHAAQANSAKLKTALALCQQGRWDQAEILYNEILRSQLLPLRFDGLAQLATLAAQLKDSRLAVELFDRALKLNPNHPGVLNTRSSVLFELKRYDEALDSCNRALTIKPDYVNALNSRGIILRILKRPEQALNSYNQALILNPDYVEALNNRGQVLCDLKRYKEALDSCNRALTIKPDYVNALNSRGIILCSLQRPEEALDSYNQALAIKPDYVEALNNRGQVLCDLIRPEEALDCYDRAIAIKPDYAEVLNSRGHVLRKLKRPEEAQDSYRKALAIKPDYAFLYGTWLYTKMKTCDWNHIEDQFAQLTEKVEQGEKAAPPFANLAIFSSATIQRKAAEIWVQANHPVSHALPKMEQRLKHDKIRLGYFSADFRNHPVSYLTAELFETHDRSKFELTAFSFGPDAQDDMRKRVMAAFDQFIDVRGQSDLDVALLARSMEIDIAVDLGGHVHGGRTDIFALRAAPIQVNYLGYPGTMGAEYIDYILADAILIPETEQRHYSEKIAYLPCFQANDTQRRIADTTFTRSELGLPQSGFVFCCFNNTYKITPDVFDSWMRILKRVEGSVLWLYEENATVATNLKKEAVLRGINPERLIFAQRIPQAEYLARYKMADLFLDTRPFNAGTTASDALWSGLPVLTCPGEAFAGRMAASLLNAIALPELIASTPEAYEALAVDMATHPEKLKAIKQKLAQNRLTAPLFNTRLFTRHMEAAYQEMYQRYQTGLAPEHIYASLKNT
jgi:predicted O-linked N-acetylglucosamine transferase (SPINDLY family)